MSEESDIPRTARRPLIVGEALIDAYPDGTEVLGGAPFNVAWHLQALGIRPILVTRVGDDPAGQKIMEEMDQWGLDLSGVQLDSHHPTGRAGVSVSDRGPVFDIAADQAFDYLEPPIDIGGQIGGPPALVYHGSLITRNLVSAEAVAAYRSRTAAPVFLDVNLRTPWWSNKSIARSLLGARWVKLNTEELCHLCDMPIASSRSVLLAAAQTFRANHALDAVVLTLGAAGAAIGLAGEILEARSSAIILSGDTTGAGDAFSAALIAGLVDGWSWQITIDRAIDLAAVVCSFRGATTTDRSLYRRLQLEWEEP